MKTIEERAVNAAITDTAKGRSRDDYIIAALADHENGFREGYIKGAAEQKAIDEAESGKELIYVVNKTTERVRKEVMDKACEWLFLNIGLYVNEQGFVDTYLLDNDFRKAMENVAHCKEERRLRPYQSREELLDAMKEHGDYVVWEYNHDWNLRILGFSNKRVNIEGHHNTTMEEAMKGFRWADGHPFGKEEQL